MSSSPVRSTSNPDFPLTFTIYTPQSFEMPPTVPAAPPQINNIFATNVFLSPPPQVAPPKMEVPRQKAPNYSPVQYGLKQVHRLMDQGLYEEALDQINSVRQKYPLDIPAIKTQTIILWKLGRLEEAIQHCGLCFSSFQSNFDFYYLRAAIWLQAHRYFEALEDIKRGFAESGNSMPTLETLRLYSISSFDKVKETALFHLNRSLEQNPARQNDLLLLRGLFFASQSDLVAAVRDMSLAIQNPAALLAISLCSLLVKARARIPSVNLAEASHLKSGRVPIAALIN